MPVCGVSQILQKDKKIFLSVENRIKNNEMNIYSLFYAFFLFCFFFKCRVNKIFGVILLSKLHEYLGKIKLKNNSFLKLFLRKQNANYV